jgi:hypothetical protein
MLCLFPSNLSLRGSGIPRSGTATALLWIRMLEFSLEYFLISCLEIVNCYLKLISCLIHMDENIALQWTLSSIAWNSCYASMPFLKMIQLHFSLLYCIGSLTSTIQNWLDTLLSPLKKIGDECCTKEPKKSHISIWKFWVVTWITVWLCGSHVFAHCDFVVTDNWWFPYSFLCRSVQTMTIQFACDSGSVPAKLQISMVVQVLRYC